MRRYVVRGALVLLAALAILAATLVVRTMAATRDVPRLSVQTPALDVDTAAAANRLAAAIRFETVSLDEQPQAADAALGALRDWLVGAYPAFHAVATRTVLEGGTLLYEWPGSDSALRPIILMAHQDVVPAASPQQWRHEPFAGVLADGAVWGRGSIDNKGSLIAILEAVEAAAAAGRTPQRTLLLVFGHDEETSGNGARAAAAHLSAHAVEAEFVLDEGSLAIADHPVTGGPVALIGISEKGYVSVQVTAHAAAGHSSAPPAQTAVGILARAIESITARPFPKRYAGATRDMLDVLAPEAPLLARMAIANEWLFRPLLIAQLGASAQGAAMLHTTIAPTMLSASPKQNVLPAEASAILNLRIAPGDSVAGVLSHLQQSLGDLPVSLTLVGTAQEPSVVSSTDSPGFALIAGAAQAVFGIPVAPAPVIAATDSRHLAAVARDIYRFQPVQLPLADVDMIHGTDEHLAVEALERMIRFYTAVIFGTITPASGS
jgi:carboxypeptidase PM20D1